MVFSFRDVSLISWSTNPLSVGHRHLCFMEHDPLSVGHRNS
jgi:hypothetical protein